MRKWKVGDVGEEAAEECQFEGIDRARPAAGRVGFVTVRSVTVFDKSQVLL